MHETANIAQGPGNRQTATTGEFRFSGVTQVPRREPAYFERAVELLAETDLGALCQKGYEAAFTRLREMRRDSEVLCCLPHSELLPESPPG